VGCKDFESGLYLLSVSTASNIEEVAWHTSLQLNNIHSGHGKACTVDHAADVSVERNIVQSYFDSFGLVRVLISAAVRLVVVLFDGSLAEGSSLININLSINTVDAEIGSYGPWVNVLIRSGYNSGKATLTPFFITWGTDTFLDLPSSTP
jgi:hypothetical protein